jgi:glycosyltransferase involved in cell wall biosynthesis
VTIKLSVITPVFNEEASVQECIQTLRNVLTSWNSDLEYEHIIIDNCSTDGTVSVISEEAITDPKIKLIVNSRNIGASRSMYRALGRVSGEWIIPMLPADLQDPADVIPMMMEIAGSGVEIVYGIRTNRQEAIPLRVLRKIYYRVLRKFSNFDIQNDAGEFVLISSRVCKSIVAVKDENPYIRGLIAQSGAKYKSVPYTWIKRRSGKSKSSFLVLMDVAISGMVSSTHIPARIALFSGFILSSFGMLAGFIYAGVTVLSKNRPIAGIPTLIVSVLFIGGIQLFFLGLIGEYVLSIHRQIKPEPKITSSLELNL